MDLLFHKLGWPPYRLEQIIALLDEASSFTSNPQIPAQDHDAIARFIEMMEEMTWRAESRLGVVSPQSVAKPDPAVIQRLGVHIDEYPNAVREIVKSIGPKTLHMKDFLFKYSQHQSRTSRPAFGTTQLCRHCNWPFQRLARRKGKSDLPARSRWLLRVSRPYFLLVIDDWPTFRVLEKRSLQGCELCLFLREHLLWLVSRRPGVPDGESVFVWIEIPLGRHPGVLKCAKVWLIVSQHFEDNLYFMGETAQSESDRVDLRMRFKS